MRKTFWLTMAVFSFIAFPALASNVGNNSLNQANARGRSNRFQFETPNNRPHSEIFNKRSRFEIPNGAIRERNIRSPNNKKNRFNRPFPFYGNAYPFYGIYGEDDYNGGEDRTVYIIRDNYSQHEASGPSAKMEKPAPPHIVTLDQKPLKQSTNRQVGAIEIIGGTVSEE